MVVWLSAVGLGLALGVVTGMPIGVINVAIVDAATSGRARFAAGLALGGGIADAIHAGVAFAGVGHVVTADPKLVRGLAIGAAIVLAIYIFIAWKARARITERAAAPPDARARRAQFLRGSLTGFVLTSPNPAALGAWVAVAAALWPNASLAEALVLAGGVGVGSAIWFTLLARWISRLDRNHRVVRWLPRVAMGLLVVIAAVGVVRAL